MKDDIILIDKPVGWTSFDVVAKIRGKIRAEYLAKGEKPTKKQLRVGHAGTLDPFATGLLIILIGGACKKAEEFLKLDKTYEFTAKLGEVSTTGDPEGVITPYLAISDEQQASSVDKDSTKVSDAVIPDSTAVLGRSESSVDYAEISLTDNDSEPAHEANILQMSTLTVPTEETVRKALKQFEGVISQVPPSFSAIKVGGQRAYKLAREGKTVEIPARKVLIKQIELIEYNFPYLKCRCDVSSGTYIRTLVEDIGRLLGTGAYCQQLCRTRIDTYDLKNAQTVT